MLILHYFRIKILILNVIIGMDCSGPVAVEVKVGEKQKNWSTTPSHIVHHFGTSGLAVAVATAVTHPLGSSKLKFYLCYFNWQEVLDVFVTTVRMVEELLHTRCILSENVNPKKGFWFNSDQRQSRILSLTLEFMHCYGM